MKSSNLGLWGALSIVCLWLAGIVGWVLNLVAIFDANFSQLTGLLVLRIIGVLVAPLGAVLGLFA